MTSSGSKLDAKQLYTGESARLYGRIWPEPDRSALWFNWTGSGFAVTFSGTTLRAGLISRPEPMTAPFEHEERILQPVIGVHTDGGELVRYSLPEGEQEITLCSMEEGEHTVILRKLSENVMGKCALVFLETDGQFLAPPAARPRQIEFIGDSITCGYGNESEEPGLRTEEENAETTYGFLAARALGADYSAVCVTGCGITDPVNCPTLQNRGMDSMLAFTDAPMERLRGQEPTLRWDFAGHPCDAVILNLGTNDMIDLAWQGYTPEADAVFRRNYRAMVADLRRLYGKETWICCTLGTMSYYLWDEILEEVRKYIAETGDTRIRCMKYGEMNPLMEGIGADGHPSVVTHARMAKELTAFLKPLLGLE